MANLCVIKTNGEKLHFINADYYTDSEDYNIVEYDKAGNIVDVTLILKNEVVSVEEE